MKLKTRQAQINEIKRALEENKLKETNKETALFTYMKHLINQRRFRGSI